MVKKSTAIAQATEDERKLPFSKEDMFDELRELILREGARIDLMRGPNATRAFLGFDYEGDEFEEKYLPEYLTQIKLEDFELARNFDHAYDYAFQIGRWMQFDEVTDCRLRGVAESFPHLGVEGSKSPYYTERSKCRHVVELAVARYHLTHYHLLPTIGQLSLLANMSDAAVRNSLSQENIKPEGKPARIENDVAWEWLQKRRGFIPNKSLAEKIETPKERTKRIFEGTAFVNAVRHAAAEAGFRGKDEEISAAMAVAAGVGIPFVGALLKGEPKADIAELEAVARALNLHIPRFTSLAIELALERRMSNLLSGGHSIFCDTDASG